MSAFFFNAPISAFPQLVTPIALPTQVRPNIKVSPIAAKIKDNVSMLF
jgi:hypothetical protein